MASLSQGQQNLSLLARKENKPITTGSSKQHASTSESIKNIAFRSVWIILPMLLFTTTFIALVTVYQVTDDGIPFPELRIPGTEPSSSAFYVAMSSTILIFISSWSSSVAPLLVGAVMYMIAHPVAKGLLSTGRSRRPEDLLTPKQFSLTLQFLDGNPGAALLSWVQYLNGWRHKRDSLSKFLTVPAFMALLMSILSFVVFLVDTWLHVTTTTVNFVQAAAVDQAQDYSLSLRTACTFNNGSVAASSVNEGIPSGEICTMRFPADHGPQLVFGNVSIQVVSNQSESMTVYNNAPNAGVAYVGISANARNPLDDFTATTYGSKTECQPVSQECNMNLNGVNFPVFDCSEDFKGGIESSYTNAVTAYFTDETMSSNGTTLGIKNPFYYGLGAQVMGVMALFGLEGDPDQVTSNYGPAFVLLCRTTMYDVEYDFVNGTVTRFVSTPSNDTIANLWQSPLEAGAFELSPYISTSLSVATINAQSIRGLADTFANLHNQVILATGAYSLQRSPESAVQRRSSRLVTRLPKAPFFVLVIVNLSFIVLGLALTVTALTNNGEEVREVIRRLTISGLVADRFEQVKTGRQLNDPEEIFEENEGKGSMKIGVDKTSTGWFRYQIWPRLKSSELRTRSIKGSVHETQTLLGTSEDRGPEIS